MTSHALYNFQFSTIPTNLCNFLTFCSILIGFDLIRACISDSIAFSVAVLFKPLSSHDKLRKVNISVLLSMILYLT